MSKKRKNREHQATATAQAEVAAQPDNQDDFIVAPRGLSRFQFFFIWALLIFVLLIFTVGGLFQTVVGGALSGGGGTDVYMTWVHPDTDETIEVSTFDWYMEKRMLARMWESRVFIPESFVTDRDRADVTDDDTAMFLIHERLASDAGFDVSDAELAERISNAFGNSETFTTWARRYRATPAQFEAEMRRVMRAEKFKGFLLSTMTVASPERVEELWGEQNPEYAFEYVEADVKDFEDEAAGSVPADEDLQAWFRELPEFRQRSHYTEDSHNVEVAWVPLDAGFDPAALFEKFPPHEDHEGHDPDAEAQTYYNLVSNVRFKVDPEEEESNDDATDESGEDTSDTGDETPSEDENESDDDEPAEEEPPRLYKTFEEVKDICLVETPIHEALGAWLADLRRRQTEGEEIDLAAEAAAIGLTYAATDTPLTRTELETADGWGDQYAAAQLAFSQEGQFVSRVVPQESGLLVGRLLEKIAGAEPPFEEIRDAIADEWKTEKAADIAAEKLEALRDQFGERTEDGAFLPTVDSDTFKSTVTGAGYEVVERPYLERFGIPGNDYDAASAGDMFIRVTAPLFELEEGQVPEAQKNAQGTHAFLVRFKGSKTADLARMTPSDLQNLRSQAISEATRDFQSTQFSLSSEEVKGRYNVHLATWDLDEAEEATDEL